MTPAVREDYTFAFHLPPSAFPCTQTGGFPMTATDITGQLARYMVEARRRKLPPQVAMACRHRILDSLAAIVSGAHLKPGEMAIRFARAQGGAAEASVL